MQQVNIKDIRVRKNLTQSQVANALGVSSVVYSRYETGRNDMKPFQIIALCEYYKVSADYILGLPEGRPYGISKTRSKLR